MRVPEGEEGGGGGAVDAFQKWSEPRTGGVHRFQYLVVGHFEIHDGGKVAQSGVNLGHAQGVGVEMIA